MLVFWNQKLVYFAVPKTGTFAIEGALAPDAAMVLRDPPAMKHMPCYTYERFLKPQLDSMGGGRRIETMAVMREPVDWLGSWYRYRAREELHGHRNSTAAISFDEFVLGYVADDRPPFARVGSQAAFLSGQDGQIFVDHLLPYADQDAVRRFFEARLGRPVSFARKNASPEMELELSPDVAARLRRAADRDFRLYDRVQAGTMSAQ